MTSIPLFAFGFASPWLLWGLAAASVPVIIHLLNKRKFRETQWAAMKFLLEAVRKNSRRIRIEQLILLAVRTLILLLLVMALARPFVETLGTYFETNQPAHKIIVVDATYSMAFEPVESNLFERARDIARSIVENAQQGDAFNLVRISDVPPTVVVQTPAHQTAEVIAEIDQLTLPHARGDVLTALKAVEKLLGAAPDLPRKDVYFLSDFQRATWSVESSNAAAELRALLKRLDDQASLVLLDIGQTGAENAAVTEFGFSESFITVGRPARFKAVVKNFGSQRIAGKSLEFFVDGKLAEQKPLDIAPSGEASETFSHVFQFGGEHRLQVRLPHDGLPLDDQRWLAVPVQEQIRVLCINGKTTARAMGKATDFLELALSPSASLASPGKSLIEPHVVNEGELPGLELGKYDCVILCNVGLFTPREADRLATYLKQGGGVIFCLGDQVQAESYNQVLYRQGEGILPAKLGDRRIVAEADRNTEAFEFDPADFAHPIVKAFEGNPDAGLQTTKLFGFVRAELNAKNPARVALKFDTGDPAIVEASIGQGKCVLVTTAVDDSWSNWPLWPSYLPLIQEMVLYAVSGRWGERQHLVGQPLTHVYPATGVEVDAAVTRPDGQTQTAKMSLSDGASQLSFDATELSGIYEVTLGHPLPRTDLFAVNVDPRESDLTKLEKDELEGELFAGLEMSYRTEWQADAAESSSPTSERGGLTRWLLYLTLGLVFVEQMMAWRFAWGAWLLYAWTTGVIVERLWVWNYWFAAGMAFVFIAVAAAVITWRTRK